MLKQLAPSAVMPPSPKNTACMVRAIEMATMAAHGPRMMAATPIPTAWPVVPPGSGRLNIMTTKEKAAKTDSSGIMRVCKAAFRRLRAIYQKGAATAKRFAQVEGLRYPSGICMASRKRSWGPAEEHSNNLQFVRWSRLQPAPKRPRNHAQAIGPRKSPQIGAHDPIGEICF